MGTNVECTVSQKNHPEGITERQKDVKYRHQKIQRIPRKKEATQNCSPKMVKRKKSEQEFYVER